MSWTEEMYGGASNFYGAYQEPLPSSWVSAEAAESIFPLRWIILFSLLIVLILAVLSLGGRRGSESY
jgi:hypothetical protein